MVYVATEIRVMLAAGRQRGPPELRVDQRSAGGRSERQEPRQELGVRLSRNRKWSGMCWGKPTGTLSVAPVLSPFKSTNEKNHLNDSNDVSFPGEFCSGTA